MTPSNAGADAPQVTFRQAQEVTPFWQRLPKFFLFPFHGPVLLAIGGLSLASIAIGFLPVPSPFDYLLGEALIWLSALRQAFNIMEKTSQGYLSPDQYSHQAPDPERVNLPWKLAGVMLLWGILQGFTATLSPALSTIIGVIYLLALPATVMALSLTNSVTGAMNPFRWLGIITGIGKPYLALLFFLFLLSGGGVMVLPILFALFPKTVLLPLVNFVFLYFNVMMFVMMGYALYQYHWELGVDIRLDPAQQPEAGKSSAPSDAAGAAIATKLVEGDLQGALDLAYEEQRQDAENLVAQDRYHQLLIQAGKRDTALAHGERYVNTLLRLKRQERAFEVYKTLRQLEPTFMADRKDLVLPFARLALKQRNPAMAMELVRAFDKRFPGHGDIPAIYLLSAQVLCDHYRKDDMARAILTTLLMRFPDHPVAAEASPLLQALENMAASKGLSAAQPRA